MEELVCWWTGDAVEYTDREVVEKAPSRHDDEAPLASPQPIDKHTKQSEMVQRRSIFDRPKKYSKSF